MFGLLNNLSDKFEVETFELDFLQNCCSGLSPKMLRLKICIPNIFKYEHFEPKHFLPIILSPKLLGLKLWSTKAWDP